MKTIGLFLYQFLKKKYVQIHKNIQKEANYKYQIELDCGEPTNIKGFKSDELENKLNSNKNLKIFAFFLFFKQFDRIGVLIYYILMILHFSYLSIKQIQLVIISTEDLVVYILPLMMHFVLQVSKALYFDQCKTRYYNQVNKRVITKFRRLRKEISSKNNLVEDKLVKSQEPKPERSEFGLATKKGHTVQSSNKKKDKILLYENTSWENIEVGDMLYIKRNEIVPADILILDISDDIFEISTNNLDGLTSETQKQPTQLTVLKNSKNKTQGFDYKKILTGIIKYDRDQSGQIKGYIKLKKDPKGEYFNQSNFLLREQQLKTCQYVIGVVLFPGKKCFCYSNFNETQAEKQSFFVQKSRMFFLLTFLISLLITIISWLISSFSVCESEKQTNFDTVTLIFYLTQYVKTTPIFFYNCIDLIEMGTAHYKYYKFTHELGEVYYPKSQGDSGNSKSINYQQINSASVGDLVMTEYVCFDKTGTLTTGDFRIRSIIIEDVMYKFSFSQLQKNQWNMFKENFLQQIRSNPNFRIAEQDEQLEDEQLVVQEEKKGKNTGIFKMNRSQHNKPSLPRNQKINNSNIFSDKNSGDISSVKSISIQQNQDDNNIMENLRPEDLDDTHCRITPDLRANKPKPFFNKSIVANQSISIQQSPPQSPYDEMHLILQQSSIKDDNRSMQQKPRSDSDATQRQMKRQQSIKRNLPEKMDEEIELVFQRDQDFYQKLAFGISKFNYQEAVLSLLLCQEITSRYSHQDDQFVHDSTSFSFDQELIRFAAQFDFKFICSNEHNGQIHYIIDILGETSEFQILAINPERPNHPRLGILVQFPERLAEEFGFGSEPETPDTADPISCVLIVREELNQLPANIDMDKFTREYWDRVFLKLHMSGMRTMVYSKIYLKEREKNEFLDKYSSLRFSGQEELIQLFNDIEKDMQIIQVIGIKEKIRSDAKNMISQMKGADLSLNILSGDDISRVLPVAYRSGILSQNDVILHLDTENAKLQIKNHLSIMSQQLKNNQPVKMFAQRLNTSEKFHKSITSVAGGGGGEEHQHFSALNLRVNQSRNNSYYNPKLAKYNAVYGEIRSFSIVLSGECFQNIQQDTALFSHFSFILFFCNSLIAYKLSSTQKAELIAIIQTQFQGNKRVLAIGDAYNDTAMFRQANIGIQYCHFLSNVSYFRGNTRKRLTQRLSCLNTNKVLENPLKKTHYMRDMWQIPTADICVTNFDDLTGLLFFESRIYAEVFDDLLVFSFYRSLLILYTLFLVYCTQCSQNQALLEGNWLTVYQSVLLFLQQIASLVSKLSRRYVGEGIMYREQFKGNIKTFKKKKVLSFIFKINGNAMLDATLLWLTLYNMQSNDIDFGIVRQMLLVLLIASDLIKLCVSTIFRYFTWISLVITYLICWILVAMLSVLYTFDNNIETFEGLFSMSISWFSLIFYLTAQFLLSNCIEILQPLFSFSLIKTEEEYMQITTHVNHIQSHKKTSYKRYHNLIKRIAVIAGKIFKKNNEEMDIAIQDIVQGSNLKVNQDKVNAFTLKFMNKDTEMKFKRVSKIIWLNYERYKLALSLFFLEVIAILLYIFYNIDNVPLKTFFIMYILSISLHIITLIAVFSSIYSKHFFFINLLIISLRFITKFITDFTAEETDGMFDILLSQSYIVILLFSRVHLPAISFLLSTLSLIGFIRKYSAYSFRYPSYQIINGDIVVIITGILFMSLQYKVFNIQIQLIRLEREQYMLAVTVNQETTQMTNVLSILLPKFIRDRINAKGMFEIQENQGEVSILFCDICGFDDIIAEQKENIVNLLDHLFRAFDSLCSQNGMQKIETVGKTYMAAGGLKACDQGTKFANQNAVKRAVQLAVEMQDYTKKFKFGQVGSLIIKIGIHYGRVIAGVIGHHKPQFSLIGDTVNTTSRVCSTGQDGQITLSEESYHEINMPEYQFIERKVNAKGKGELITYQVNTQIQRGQNKKTRKRAGLIPKSDERIGQAPKLKQQGSLFVQQQQLASEDKIESSQKVIAHVDSHGTDNKDKDGFRFKRRVNKGPTLVLRNLANQQQQQQQQQQLQQQQSNSQISKIPSHNTIPLGEKEAESQSQINQVREDSFTEKSNLLNEVSQKLRRDFQIDFIEEQPDFEIEADKVKGYFDDDSQIETESLQLERKKLYLGFKDHQYMLAKEFIELNAEGRNIVFISIYLHLFQYLAKTLTLFLLIGEPYQQNIYLIIIIRLGSSFVLLILALLQNKKLKHRFYKGSYFITTYTILLFCIALEAIFISDQEGFELQASEGILLICFFCSLSIVQILHKVIFIIIFFLTQILIVLLKFEVWALAYYTIFQCILMFIVQYNIFIQDLNTFNNKRSLEVKKSQSSNLVKYLLPSHILKQFLSNNNQRVVLTDNFEEATLLFADIAGFTEYSSRVEPEQVVNMLRNLFTEFDKKCLTQNTYKLYTIGDCYVVIGVLDVTQRSPAQEAKNVVELGFQMIEIIRNVRQIIGFDGLDMRIGVHTGKVIGGILGTEIVRYDVYGADVMISNKMESNGEKGRVQVSEETKQLLEAAFPDSFTYSFNKLIEFKSINRKTNGYFIDPTKNDSNEAFEELDILDPPSEQMIDQNSFK